jgi:DNA (cytosine-5)-methyltransferase 1
MARIIREVRPRRVLVENSPNLVNDGLGTVLGDLAAMGFHARWGVLGAEQFGGDILRKRAWIVASSDIDGLQGIVKWMQEARKRRNLPSASLDTPRSVRLDRHKLSESIILRKSDDVADRVDRTRAVGNGQVPVVAAAAYRILSGDR